MNASNDWQSWAALFVVLGTLVIFVRRAVWKKKKVGGCPSCGGASSKPIPSPRTSSR